jgi:hypothetical protein
LSVVTRDAAPPGAAQDDQRGHPRKYLIKTRSFILTTDN